ncbi:hypothetical protein [Amycolatopsis sp. CA-128772]|uniref:hypothetical protein n=1 Tax=Amycolatopsis sp. CA-128772 TaxID=2073159 RepID=UPI000CD21EB6|nr:hypothetical protein [Amycolatopsis sp. CA-128772]
MTEYTAQQVVDFLKSGDGPGSLFESSRTAEEMAAKHVEARDMMARLQSAMSEAWTGNAAGQAQAGAGPLLAASEVSAVHLSAAREALVTQGSDYADLKNKVGDGPGPQPGEDFLSRHLPMLTNKDEEIAGWNAKAQEVVQHYGTYFGQSGDNTAGLPSDYGDLTLPAGGADIEHAGKPPAVTPPGGHDDRTAGTRQVQPVDHRETPIPGQDISWQQQRPGATDPHTTTGSTGPGQNDTTHTSGLSPVASTGDSPNRPGYPSLPGGGFGRDGGSGDINARLGTGVPGLPGTGGPGTGGPGRVGSGGEPGGGRTGTGPGSPRGGGGEPGGGRTGTGPGSPRGGVGEPGGGRTGTGPGSPRSGVGEPGGRSGTGRFGEPGMSRAGVTGAAGKPGAGGLGGPLGRGEKEEDKEHKRLDILQEPDPDELFGGFPDGMKPVPPTIGA